MKHVYSQDWAKTIIKNQQRVDLRDLGYPGVNEIPVNSSAITSQDVTLWKDIKRHFKDYTGGHLYCYNPVASNENVKLVDRNCETEDLGMPLARTYNKSEGR